MTQPVQPLTLNLENLAQGLDFLSKIDPDLAGTHARLGPPPLWAREPGFPTLVHIILEQQVSLASARAAFTKLKEAAGEITPAAFLEFEPDELKRIGFSRQKAAYCRILASSILNHELDLDNLIRLDDASARSALTRIKGIGPWTADIYLLMVLLRPDSWPIGDLALAVALQELKGLPSRPTPAELERIADPWRPWRAVAARLLWHAYLHKRGLD
jgi:DNA-3-methyladenine glycosylase II